MSDRFHADEPVVAARSDALTALQALELLVAARSVEVAYRLPGLTTMSPETFLAPAVTSTR
jgi:hypothetical protein